MDKALQCLDSIAMRALDVRKMVNAIDNISITAESLSEEEFEKK
jgi:hypothetical protein